MQNMFMLVSIIGNWAAANAEWLDEIDFKSTFSTKYVDTNLTLVTMQKQAFLIKSW